MYWDKKTMTLNRLSINIIVFTCLRIKNKAITYQLTRYVRRLLMCKPRRGVSNRFFSTLCLQSNRFFSTLRLRRMKICILPPPSGLDYIGLSYTGVPLRSTTCLYSVSLSGFYANCYIIAIILLQPDERHIGLSIGERKVARGKTSRHIF